MDTREQVRDLRLHEKITLKWILHRQDGRRWIRLVWPSTGNIGCLCNIWVLQESSWGTVTFWSKTAPWYQPVSCVRALSNGTSLPNLRLILHCYKPTFISSGSGAVFAVSPSLPLFVKLFDREVSPSYWVFLLQSFVNPACTWKEPVIPKGGSGRP
jgi:hypothetical protein